MLAEILANPVAWPLWAVLVFAASMYPLGFMLPGCVCCQSGGNCTTCGTPSLPYEEQFSPHGRMCCTGTAAPSMTLRITTTSAATITTVTRDSPSAANYNKYTRTYSCSQLDGDYVLALSRTTNPSDSTFTMRCLWQLQSGSGSLYKSFSVSPSSGFVAGAPPYTNPPYPQWYMFWTLVSSIQATFLTQRCAGPPATENCNAGTTSITYATFFGDFSYSLAYPAFFINGPRSTQSCTPPSMVFNNAVLLNDPNYDPVFPSGGGRGSFGTCAYRVEIV
jgi:hypothetical protein